MNYLSSLVALLLVLTMTASNAAAQVLPSSNWTDIENSIKTSRNLQETLAKVNKAKFEAQLKGNEIAFARYAYYQMLIKDLKTEDSLYFKNSAFIDSLLTDPASSDLLKNVMHLLQARRLKLSQFKNLKFKTFRFPPIIEAYNYRILTQQERDSLIRSHFDAVLKPGKIPQKATEDLNWLSSTADQLPFKADLADIAHSERISYEFGKNNILPLTADQVKELITASSAKFGSQIMVLNAMDKSGSKLLESYLRWMDQHIASPEKLQYIQLLLKYLMYTQYQEHEMVRKAWKNYLQEGLKDKSQITTAAAAYHLFLLYFREGSRYGVQFQDKYKGQLALAVNLHEQHQLLLNQFPSYRNGLETMLRKIKAQELRFQTEDRQIPGQPILITTRYRNAQKLFYRIVKIGVEELLPTDKMKRLALLLRKPAFRDSSFTLPYLAGDYDKHSTYLKLEALPIGSYYLLFSVKEIKDDQSNTSIEDLKLLVSNLAAVNTGDRFMVLHRKTGAPLKDVKASASYYLKEKNKKVIPEQLSKQNFLSDAQGFIFSGKKSADNIVLILGKDTLLHQFTADADQLPKGVYHEAEYEDLEDFYDEEAKLHIYTDRSIYRPGQQVFYKVILSTRDAATGTPVVFSEATNPTFKKWLLLNKPQLILKNPNRKTIDTIKLNPDAYGSFSGSFLLAKDALPGRWEISSNHVDAESGDFRVEEYKRPTLEMTMEKPKEGTIPGETFELKLKVKSLSGADLKNVMISYQLEKDDFKYGRSNRKKTRLLDSIGYTDTQGELVIRVKDAIDPESLKSRDNEQCLSYQLNAIATESSGESIQFQDQYFLSSWPVKIDIPTENYYDRKQLPTLSILAKSTVSSYKPDRINLSIYKLEQVLDTLNPKKVDQWLYSKENLKNWFPNLNLYEQIKQEKQLLLTQEMVIDSAAKYVLHKELFTTGSYEIIASTQKSGQLSGQSTRTFQVFDSQERTVPGQLKDFNYLPYNSVNAGDTLSSYTAAVGHAYVTYCLKYYAKTNKGLAIKTLYHSQYQNKGLQVYAIKMPKDAVENLLFTSAYVLNNHLYKNEHSIYLQPTLKEQPEIIIEKYKKVMTPGAKETFSISIKTAKENIAAQLMTVLYDASLDKLESHNWGSPFNSYFNGYFSRSWSYNVTNIQRSNFDLMQLRNDDFINDDYYRSSNLFQGRVPGLSIEGESQESNRLDEVVMKGYGMQMNGSVQIRGLSQQAIQNQVLMIVDGVPYTGSLDKFDPGTIQMMVLKGAEATALYGSNAAGGVIIISTNGKIILPKTIEEPKAVIRKDFKETAFFYPAIYADKNGLYTFSFTMPQTATAWNWKMLAHTQKGLFAYAERKLNTRLNLMVQPNMPRLLYQGDELVLKSRVSNLDSIAMNVKLSCRIEDAVTGEDLTLRLLKGQSSKMIYLPGQQTSSDGFNFKIPEDQLNPLKILTTATGPGIADAEEHTLPILPKKIFVREQLPLVFSTKDSVINTPVFPSDVELYGLGIYIDPKPQAAVINALPYLVNYPYDCAEQTFNKLFAYVTAGKLMKTDAAIAASFLKAGQVLATDSSRSSLLPDELTENSMPWLNLANHAAKQQKQLYQTLDTLASKSKMLSLLEKLYKMQNYDGGVPWFEGGLSNNWITNYLIRGFAKLQKAGWIAPKPQEQEAFLKKMITYADLQFLNNNADSRLDYADARSYWKSQYIIEQPVYTKIQESIGNHFETLDKASIYTQALWITAASKYAIKTDQLTAKIESQRKNILERAISDEHYGLRWKELSSGENLNHSKEETIAMLYEAFAGNKSVRHGLVKWMLTARKDYSWSSTTGTAAAIEMIQATPELNISAAADIVTAKVEDQEISVSNDMMSGKSNQFIALSKKSSTIQISANHPAAGGLTWYYFSASANTDAPNPALKLVKSLYTFNAKLDKWLELAPAQEVKVGDKIKVLLTVETEKPLRFLQIDDKRAGAFEPLNNSSGQQYEAGIPYYKAIRDSGQQLFIDFLPSGRSEFSYEVIVSQEGTFRNGAAVLQCLYHPGITAYSNSIMIRSKAAQQ
ncbi:TonB-dependent receptor plug domain-containing protein [Pedobacter sp. N36a]|uniref:alpha-2-macroglobulin family protein n=1 Tax=Pedobacter sp. N36a TaxID=2767996 RepID=UPI0016570041|nr:MG2 domain-containing protein [Pedobacter sp. N36a]MBC8986355.1 TonB-dependent receptor plug domain-containing protein [Pedobacter sp. N36a]